MQAKLITIAMTLLRCTGKTDHDSRKMWPTQRQVGAPPPTF